MESLRSYVRSTLLIGCVLLMPAAADVNACSAPRPPSGRGLVASAHVIVRVIAVASVEGQGVDFRVEEVLKGKDVPASLILSGRLSAEDDFNDRPVPYDFVRPGGRGGECHAYEYKQGAQFLLFLKQRKGKLTPYWVALAATNEQLRSTDDPWLAWVKDHLKWLEKASEAEREQVSFEELKRGGWDTDNDLLWGYLFIDPDEEKLRRLGKHLESLGYHFAGVLRSEDEDKADGYVLRVEKAEVHTHTTMAERGREFRTLAATFGVGSYGNWFVRRVK